MTNSGGWVGNKGKEREIQTQRRAVQGQRLERSGTAVCTPIRHTIKSRGGEVKSGTSNEGAERGNGNGEGKDVDGSEMKMSVVAQTSFSFSFSQS